MSAYREDLKILISWPIQSCTSSKKRILSGCSYFSVSQYSTSTGNVAFLMAIFAATADAAPQENHTNVLSVQRGYCKFNPQLTRTLDSVLAALGASAPRWLPARSGRLSNWPCLMPFQFLIGTTWPSAVRTHAARALLFRVLRATNGASCGTVGCRVDALGSGHQQTARPDLTRVVSAGLMSLPYCPYQC